MQIQLFRFAVIALIILSSNSCRKQSNVDSAAEEYIETEPPVLTTVSKNINPAIGGYYIALPAHYLESSRKYPLLLFIHGGGQFGNGGSDLPILLNEAIPELLNEKLFPPNFNANGKNYSFVILAPQFQRVPSNAEVFSLITFAKETYRIDSARIYITGLSLGGRITCDVGAEYADQFAAIVPIAGVSIGGVSEKCRKLANGNLPIWIFHNDMDNFSNVEMAKNFVSLINTFDPTISPKFTEFPAFGLYGHDAWTKATDPNYREDGMNMYEWMLQYTN